MKNFFILMVFLLISCGGGSTVQSPPEAEPITFKNVPDGITVLD